MFTKATSSSLTFNFRVIIFKHGVFCAMSRPVTTIIYDKDQAPFCGPFLGQLISECASGIVFLSKIVTWA